MKKQIIAKINNIANELDRNGLYAEANALTNVMKRLADESGSMIDAGICPDCKETTLIDGYCEQCEYDANEEDDSSEVQTPTKTGLISVKKFDENFVVGLTIENTYMGEFRGTENAEGEFERFKSGDEANRYAIFLKVKYRDVKFKMNFYDPNRPSTRRIPGDPYDAYKDANPFRNEEMEGFGRGRR